MSGDTSTTVTVDEATRDALVRAARKIMFRAYAPYSNFHVGAAILTRSGAVHLGVNVENASYPVGACAERMAIGAAYTAGDSDAIAIAVATDAPTPVMPCGMCAQALFEVSPQILIIASGHGDVRAEARVSDILPHAYHGEGLHFGPNSTSSTHATPAAKAEP